MKKVLILGIGSPQADAIKYCKGVGCEVFSCAADEHGPGKEFADHFTVIDIKDIEGVYQYVLDNDIDVLYSAGSDVAIPTASYISGKLNLPHFFDYETSLLFRNKGRIRAKLGDRFVGNLAYLLVSNFSETKNWTQFPCVLKPVDSQGQRAVCIVNTKQQLQEAFETVIKQSPTGEAIIEDYIQSPEISVNIYLINGEVVFLQTTDRIVYDEYPAIVKAHRIPSKVVDQLRFNKVNSVITSLVRSLDLKNGPLYLQMKFSGNTPILIEAAPRLDGCHLWQLIDKYCGVNLLKITFDHLLENKVEIGKPANKGKELTLQFITEKPGVIFDQNNYSKYISDLSKIQWYYSTGETVKFVNGYQERIGHYINYRE